MKQKIKLRDVLDALEFTSSDINYFFEKKTEKIYMISEFADNLEDNLEAQQRLDENPDDFIALPNEYEINEYQIIKSFCCTLEDEKVCDALLHRIQGRGAFRNFKDALYEFELRELWHTYHHGRLKEIAYDWCQTNELDCADE